MNRILSQSGNVIAADFGTRRDEICRDEISLALSTHILYADTEAVVLRVKYTLNGRPVATQHIVVDL